MTESPQENHDHKKALKKLVSKWLAGQGTKGKATALLAKKPAIKKAIAVKRKKA